MALLNIKKDFAIFDDGPIKDLHPEGFSYLDTAASSLKPKCVVDRMSYFYNYESSNVHRGAHRLSQTATQFYEESRSTIKDFIGARCENEIIFTSGTTDGVNLVANSIPTSVIGSGDVILLTELEHHSNIVPWQVLADKRGAHIEFVKILDSGELDYEDFSRKITGNVKLVSVTYCSNVLGVLTDLKLIIDQSHKVGAKVFVDAAQVVSTLPVNVQDLDCDFLAFSSHKMFGPYGVGVLYGRETLLNEMEPYRTGGSMIDSVTTKGTTYLQSPQRFEAGTPPISCVIGMAEAAKYIQGLGYKAILAHENQVLKVATEALRNTSAITIYGDIDNKINVISFNIDGVHPSDAATLLDQEGVMLRSGHHCAQPLMKRLGLEGTLRASFSIYNDLKDVENLIKAIEKTKGFFL